MRAIEQSSTITRSLVVHWKTQAPVLRWIEDLERLAAIAFSVGPAHADESPDEISSEMRSKLEQVDSTLGIVAGENYDILSALIAQGAPELHPRFISARSRAVTQIKSLRGVLRFLLEEGDDEDFRLDDDDDLDAYPAAPSVQLDLDAL